MKRAGECVNCGQTREIAQQRAGSANDPALKALIAMRGGRRELRSAYCVIDRVWKPPALV